jgi:hypothetical protein
VEPDRNDSPQKAMIIRLKKIDSDEPQSGRAPDASSNESRMVVDDVHGADFRPAVTPNRRLRNWLLLANALAWIVIVVVIRWLFF